MYFRALRGYLHEHGCPVAFYADKHSVFRVVRQDTKGGQGMTQFGCALSELNIEILCANSGQLKGRVERANRTLQDRLVNELRLAGISNMESGNTFLPEFIQRYNARFSVPAARTLDLHRPLRTTTPRLNDILCHREQRYVVRSSPSIMTASRSSSSRPTWLSEAREPDATGPAGGGTEACGDQQRGS